MSGFSLLVSKGSGFDQAKQTSMELRNRNNSKNIPKLSSQRLFNQIRSTVARATEHQFLIYENVDSQTGSLVVDSLVENGEVERARPR